MIYAQDIIDAHKVEIARLRVELAEAKESLRLSAQGLHTYVEALNSGNAALAAKDARIAELEEALHITLDEREEEMARAEKAKAELDISREAHRMVQSALLSQAAETERAEAERDALRELLEMLQSAQWLKPAQRKAIRAALAPSPAERDCGCEDASKCWGGSPGIKCRRPFPSPAGREG